jgi:hypothetical protein
MFNSFSSKAILKSADKGYVGQGCNVHNPRQRLRNVIGAMRLETKTQEKDMNHD